VDDLLSEKEQIDKMRAWWSDNGSYVISGLAISIIGVFGFNYYENSQREAAYQSSGLYDALTDMVVDGEVAEAEAIAAQLEEGYGETNYLAQARLAMARMYMDQNRDEDAADSLRTVLAMGVEEEFKDVARIRLAKILLYQDKAQEAADLVEGREDGAFAERYADILGDAYVALNRPDEARLAYQRALFEDGTGATVDQNFVQLKLLDLPVVAAPALAEEPMIDEAAAEGTGDDASTTPDEGDAAAATPEEADE
jgi:predicted negative regulator of RcsB-dependent stress response